MTIYENIGEPSVPNAFWNLPFDIVSALFTSPVSLILGAAIVAGFIFYVYGKLIIGPRPE